MKGDVVLLVRPDENLVPKRPRRPRWRRRLAAIAWPMIMLLGATLVILNVMPPWGAGAPARTVVASVPYWNLDHGTATILSNREDFTEVSPWMYGLAPDGRIVQQYGPGEAAGVSADLDRLRSAGVRVVPTLANITNGSWAYEPVASILHHPARTKQHVADIVSLVERNDYAGIDIDYEELRATDREAFSAFVTHLADALHAKDKILSVAVFAKTSDAGSDQRNVAQNFAAIGRAADQVRLMAYDYHWAGSGPGPIAPIDWVRAVVRYARSQIPDRKIILGIPLYGYDWSGGHGQGIAWLEAFRLSRQYHVDPKYDRTAQAPSFNYTDASGQQHTVWFENRASSRAKLGVAQGSKIGGVYFWMFGYEDSGTWKALRKTLLNGEDAAELSARETP